MRAAGGGASGSALPLFLVLAIGAAASSAHELYLRPSSFHPDAGERVAVALEVGHAFAGSPVERRPGHLRRFVAVASDGRIAEVEGVDGAVPAGWLPSVEPGAITLSYESHAMLHRLPGERFDAYLREEGLDAAIALRGEDGGSAEPVRELFSRCAKAVLEVAPATGDLTSPIVGCPLELVPRVDLLAPGAEVSVRVLWEGRPLRGVLVRLTRAGEAAPTAEGRSDAGGEVSFDVGDDAGAGSGPWLVHAVHITPVAPAAGSVRDAEWRSVWTSLTFQRRNG